MDKKNLIPEQAQPVERMATGQLASELAELSEEVLETSQGEGIVPQSGCFVCVSTGVLGGAAVGGGNIGGNAGCFCSYEGDDAE